MLAGKTLEELRARAVFQARQDSTPVERTTVYRRRSQAIKAYALKRSEGICAGCHQPAPFRTRAGLPFLEVHHLNRLSDGGADHPEAVIAVCPNCHRRAHYSEDAAGFNDYLRAQARSQEAVI